MNISISSILSSLIFSSVGLWLLRQAKIRSNLKLIPIGIGLMGYTYFTTTPILDWGIGFVLTLAAYAYWE